MRTGIADGAGKGKRAGLSGKDLTHPDLPDPQTSTRPAALDATD